MSKFQLEMNEKLSLKVGLIGLRVGLFGVTKFSEGGNVHCCRRLPGPDRDRDYKFEVCGPWPGLGLGWLVGYTSDWARAQALLVFTTQIACEFDSDPTR